VLHWEKSGDTYHDNMTLAQTRGTWTQRRRRRMKNGGGDNGIASSSRQRLLFLACFLFVISFVTMTRVLNLIKIIKTSTVNLSSHIQEPSHPPSSSSPLVSNKTSVLFVKFHKVAGTTVSMHLDEIMEDNHQLQHTCTDHRCSLKVAEKMRNFINNKGINKTVIRRQFYDLLVGAKNTYKKIWLPKDSSLKVFTILRDPSERLRSQYYFQRRADGFCLRKHGKKCAAAQLTFMEWMTYEKDERDLKKAGSLELSACCEYVEILGGGDVQIALTVISYLFDVVGVTEHLDRSLSEMTRVVSGSDGTNFTVKYHIWNNSANKNSWTVEEKAMADSLTQKDRIIYEEALRRASANWLLG